MTWHIVAAFAAGMALGVIVAGILTHAFWKGFFEGFVVELSMRLADSVNQQKANGLRRVK